MKWIVALNIFIILAFFTALILPKNIPPVICILAGSIYWVVSFTIGYIVEDKL